MNKFAEHTTRTGDLNALQTDIMIGSKYNHARCHAALKKTAGFTIIEIAIVVAVIGLLAAIAVPAMTKSRCQAQTHSCVNNLRQIDAAIQQWAAETGQPETSAVGFSDISVYLKGSVVCPAGGTSFADSYTIGTVADNALCQRSPSTHLLYGSGDSGTASPGITGTSGTGGSSGTGTSGSSGSGSDNNGSNGNHGDGNNGNHTGQNGP